jgi:hypothetical protein
MSRRILLRGMLPAVLVVAFTVFGAASAQAGPTPGPSAPVRVPPVPSVPALALASCAGVHAIAPLAPDGDYVLVTDDTILTVYCHDMAGTPREYVTLPNTGPDQNFSQYTAGLASRGTNVRTSYRKVRIDPATLRVDIGDTTFATSTGSLVHSNSGTVVTSMPYGEAMSCTYRPDGVGNIDLRGTGLTVVDPFIVRGFPAPVGSATFSAGNQVVDLVAGAYCGWISAAPEGPPYNTTPGDFRLDLACAAPSGGLLTALLAARQFCYAY